jgi:hypothetical protein
LRSKKALINTLSKGTSENIPDMVPLEYEGMMQMIKIEFVSELKKYEVVIALKIAHSDFS